MKKIIVTIILSFLFAASSAQAGSLYFSSNNNEIKTGGFFETSLSIDYPEADINAVEGRVYFPKDLLEFVDYKENNSIVNFWIEKPELKGDHVRFSGIIPGGYIGQGNLFELIFRAKKSGQGNLRIEDFKILLNDGLGTQASVDTNVLGFNISDSASVDEPVIIVDLSDQDPPEPFTPMISQIPEIAGESYLLMFNTQDKGSGIDYYQVKEGYRPFIDAESPYVLKNQNLDRKIVVKAVDKSGNERKVTISPVYPDPWYEKYSFFAIIIFVIAVAYFLGRVSRKKSQPK